jgi:hypothetical protein
VIASSSFISFILLFYVILPFLYESILPPFRFFLYFLSSYIFILSFLSFLSFILCFFLHLHFSLFAPPFISHFHLLSNNVDVCLLFCNKRADSILNIVNDILQVCIYSRVWFMTVCLCALQKYRTFVIIENRTRR